MSTWTQMWQTRPARIPEEQGGRGQIAGVCEGIAVRYQIDPLILRISFVVLACFGGGIALYLAAWALMPRYSVPVSPIQCLFSADHPEERSRGWWLLFGFLLCSGFLGSTTLLSLLIAGLAWWALHRKEPVPPAGLLTTCPDTPAEFPMDHVPRPDLSGITPAEGYPYPPGRTTPPAWDPLGTAPFAWDLPEPAPAPVAAKPTRLRPWLVLGAGGLITATVITGGLLDFSGGPDLGPVGDIHHAPSSLNAGNHTFRGGIGETTVDLRNLNEVSAGQEVTIEGSIGDLDVHLPEDIPIHLRCTGGLGDSNCSSGNYNQDAGGETLLVHIRVGVGDTDIHWD